MIHRSASAQGVIALDGGNRLAATSSARGLLIGLALSQVFWIAVGVAVVRVF